MPVFHKLFVLFGLTLKSSGKLNFFWFALRILSIATFFVAGVLRHVSVPPDYRISLTISTLVYTFVCLCAATVLTETLRTTKERTELVQKLREIDLELVSISNIFHKIEWSYRIYSIYIVVCLLSPVIFIPLGIAYNYVGYFYMGLYVQCYVKFRFLQMTVFLDELFQRIKILNRRIIYCENEERTKNAYKLLLEYKELFHKCFQNSLFILTVYDILDLICMMHRLLMAVIGILHWTYIVMSLAVIVPLLLHIICINLLSLRISNEHQKMVDILSRKNQMDLLLFIQTNSMTFSGKGFFNLGINLVKKV